MAALSKITDLHGFSDQIVLHSGLPYRLALVVAAFLPWLELTCGLCLALGAAVREAALLLTLLLLMLLVYSLLHYGEGDCGCFLFPTFPSSTTRAWWPLLRNLLLLLCGMRLIWR